MASEKVDLVSVNTEIFKLKNKKRDIEFELRSKKREYQEKLVQSYVQDLIELQEKEGALNEIALNIYLSNLALDVKALVEG